MGRLPDLSWDMASIRWAAILEPVIAAPIIQGRLLENVSLVTGSNTVNHGLSRKLRGWIIVDIDGAAQIYSAQASNQMPQLTLKLTSDADVTVSLWVF